MSIVWIWLSPTACSGAAPMICMQLSSGTLNPATAFWLRIRHGLKVQQQKALTGGAGIAYKGAPKAGAPAVQRMITPLFSHEL